MNELQRLAVDWHDRFNRLAGDLHPGRYTRLFCFELAEQAIEIRRIADEKGVTIVAHNYQVPEIQEVAHFVGDSLGLALQTRDSGATNIHYSTVHFMAATGKLIVGDKARVFVQGDPSVHGCSLVNGTDHRWLEHRKRREPDTVFVTYVNSDVYTKAMSDYICTSRNTAEVIALAAKEHPTSKILLLPDKYLGYVMRAQAIERYGVDPDRIEVYSHPFNGNNACCYVHEKIGADAPERALEDHEDAELLLHPECGCASACLLKLSQGILPKDRVYYLSTEGMLRRVAESDAKTFVVGTELGMVYRLRKEAPERTFVPISQDAVCGFMKENSLERMLDAIRNDRIEIVLDDDVDPRSETVEGDVIRIHRPTGVQALAAVERMLVA